MSTVKYLKKVAGVDAPVRVDVAPSFGMYEATKANDDRDVKIDGLWYPASNGGELVTNGTFDTDTTGWTAYTTELISQVSGTMRLERGTGSGYVYQAVPTIVGESYNFSLDLTEVTTGNLQLRLGTTITGLEIYDFGALTTTGTYTHTFTATSTTTYIVCALGNPSVLFVDNISLFKTQPTLGTAYNPQPAYLNDGGKLVGFEVADGDVVDLHYDIDYPKIVEDVIQVDKVIQTGNRKIIELGTIFNNNRYVEDNPFGNENYEDCDVKVEIFYNGIWSEASIVSYGNLTGGCGVSAFSNLEGIVIQTAVNYLIFPSIVTGNGFGTTSTSVTSAPARVIVTYQGNAQ
jgi:hypothetical protein